MNNNELAVNTSIEDIYGDNPLITQLPPILDTKSVIKHLRGKLKFIPEQRFLPQPERIHLIAQLPHDFSNHSPNTYPLNKNFYHDPARLCE